MIQKCRYLKTLDVSFTKIGNSGITYLLLSVVDGESQKPNQIFSGGTPNGFRQDDKKLKKLVARGINLNPRWSKRIAYKI
jgi:hypothetical protein